MNIQILETGCMHKMHVWNSKSKSSRLKCYTVDIRPEIVKSFAVFATSYEDACDIVDKMMEENLIPLKAFESTGDYEIDIDQPNLDEYNFDTFVETIEEVDEKLKRSLESD